MDISACRLAAGAALVALAVGACGSTATKSAGTKTSTPRATTSAPATNGAEKMSAAQVTHAALDALAGARSVHVTGTAMVGGGSENFDQRFVGKSSSGSYTMKGAVIQTIVIGKDSYLKAGMDGWQAMGNSPDAASMMADQWFKVSSVPTPGVAAFSLALFTTELAMHEYTPGATVAQATLAGQKVVVVAYQDGSKLYVANVGPMYPVRFDVTGNAGGQRYFGQYGAEFHITAPQGARDIGSGG